MAALRQNHCSDEEAQKIFVTGSPLTFYDILTNQPCGSISKSSLESLTADQAFEEKIVCGKGYHNFIDIEELRLREAWDDCSGDVIRDKVKRDLFRNPDWNVINNGSRPLLCGDMYSNNWYFKKVRIVPKLKSVEKAKVVKSPERVALEQKVKEICKAEPFKSPYEDHLKSLRMKEVRLLEQKRLQVFESIRGPQPRWYELKSTKFTNEITRNNVMQANSHRWQGLVNASAELLSSPIE